MMKHANLFTLLVASILGTLAFACSSDDSSDAGPSTSVPSDKQLSALTDAEVAQLNSDVSAYAAQQAAASMDKNTICQMAGAMAAGMTVDTSTTPTDASLQQACSTIAEACMQNSADVSSVAKDVAPSEDRQVSKEDLANCTATVAEYMACMKDGTAASVGMLKNMPKCADLTAASLDSETTVETTVENPASCQTFASKCPDA